MKRQKSQNSGLTVRLDDLLEYEPLTANQEKAFKAWDDDYNLVLAGSAGTGKTFIGMYLGLETVLDSNTLQNQLVVVRSMVPTREMGFLPGSKNEKEEVYFFDDAPDHVNSVASLDIGVHTYLVPRGDGGIKFLEDLCDEL